MGRSARRSAVPAAAGADGTSLNGAADVSIAGGRARTIAHHHPSFAATQPRSGVQLCIIMAQLAGRADRSQVCRVYGPSLPFVYQRAAARLTRVAEQADHRFLLAS